MRRVGVIRGWSMVLALGFGFAGGCTEAPIVDHAPPIAQGDTPAVEVETAWLDAHHDAISAAADLTIAGFAQAYPEPAFVETLSFDPTRAELIDRVLEAYPLHDDQRAALAKDGFVVVPQTAGGFTDNYFWAYQRDLPVMITADSLLHAWHSSYDTALAKIEAAHLQPALDRAMAALHARIAAVHREGAIPPGLVAALREADVFATVALTLLRGHAVDSALGDPTLADRAAVLARAVVRAVPDGPAMKLGGAAQQLDYTQFAPRGRYTDSPALSRYFRSMQWLARARMRVVDHDPDGTVRFDRAALDTAVVLGWLLRSIEGRDALATLDAPLTRLVGPMDGATFDGAARSIIRASTTGPADPGGHEIARYAGLDDSTAQRLATTLFTDTARIDPQGAVRNVDGKAPLDLVAFAQRYTFDGRVLNDVTYDRLEDGAGKPIERKLPSELDVMFVLGSNTAGALLHDELERWHYQGTLHVLRQTVATMGRERWDRDLVHGWLDTIGALGDTTDHARLPQAMRTRAWSKRLLEAQLASWAELRRDNVLYIKPTESMVIGCEFPSAYVEPNPLFFDRLGHLVEQGLVLEGELRKLGIEVPGLRPHFEHWRSVTNTLAEIVDAQLAHVDRSRAQRSFLRQLIELEEEGYGTRIWDGWFPRLYLDRRGWQADAVVADVHTAAEGEPGERVGRVLHVGTDAPRNLVVTIDDGPRARAFVGPVSTFRRTVTSNFERLTEDQWLERVMEVQAADWQRVYAPR